MTRQHQIVINKVDNGFTIREQPDDRKHQSLVAKDEAEVKKLVTDLVGHMFDPVPAKTEPE